MTTLAFAAMQHANVDYAIVRESNRVLPRLLIPDNQMNILMQNTVAFSTRLLGCVVLLGTLGACGGGGSGGDDDPPPPPANQPPVLDAIGAQSVEEAQQLSFTVTATDAETTTPTLSVTGLPSGATFNASNGLFNWTTVAGDAASSPYSVTFTATDSGGLTDTEAVTITVTVPANQTPVLTSIGNKGAQETQALNFTVEATDVESTTPVLGASGVPDGANFDAATGAFEWTPVAGDAASSPYSIVFTATDQVDASLVASETISITVAPEACATFPSVTITSPAVRHLQTSDSLAVETLTCFNETHTGWGVKLSLDNAGTIVDEAVLTSGPFSQTFANVARADYTVRAVAVDDGGNEVTGGSTEDAVTPVGVGDSYVAIGDSVTFGIGDFEASDNTSNDGRDSSRGYPPILNNLLTDALGYPHTIVNAGVEGDNSAAGLLALPAVLAANPDAQRVLIKYGMNDARVGMLRVPSGLGLNPGDGGYPGTFKDNMQRIIDAINADGKEAVLAKVNIALGDSADPNTSPPYPDPNTGDRSLAIREFNMVIDELRAISANNINITPPDFYDLFLTDMRYDTEYTDNIHPNGTGYQSMAELWAQELTP